MRILLEKGEQNKFIEKILSVISVPEAAKLCGLSERTIRDWRREKFLMQKSAMVLLSGKTKVPLPENFKEKDDYWYANPWAGAAAAIKKYGYVGGNPEYRIKKRREWWEKEGRFKKHNILFTRKPIHRPGKSEALAEFIGIMLGDGGITKWAQQIKITLNNQDDKEYIVFVCQLMEKLFDRKPSVSPRKSAAASVVSISSMDLVDYLVRLGLKTGNKTKLQVDIPDWIKNNKAYSIACVRGLMDTDGCIFHECHTVKGKEYCYPRLCFVTASVPLRDSVVKILHELGLNPKIRNISKRYVQIEDKEKIKEYFKIIGTSNPKHLNRYHK